MAVIVALRQHLSLIVAAGHLNAPVRPLCRGDPVAPLYVDGLTGGHADDRQDTVVPADTSAEVYTDDVLVMRMRSFVLL